MTLGGKTVRVEVNWNALASFLQFIGEDSYDGLANVGAMRPSQAPALMAAASNEGERLEGRESNLKAVDVGALIKPSDVTAFLNIYVEHSRVQMEVDEPKKEDGESQQS